MKAKMRAKIVLLFFFFFSYGNASAADVLLKKSIRIEHSKGCVLLRIIYKNEGSSDVYLDPDEPAIDVVGKDGKPLRFIGMMAKRPALSLEDYRKVIPGEEFTDSINLNESYELRQKGDYTVSIDNEYRDPITRQRYLGQDLNEKFYYEGRCRSKRLK